MPTGAMALMETAILATGFRYFLAVAEAGSIRAAAKQLNIVSSAVDRQILMLERSLGIELFDRVGRGLRLSEAGRILLKKVRQTIADYSDVVTEISALRGLQRGKVRVATVESVTVNLLPELLIRFWERWPGIEIAATVTGADAVTRLVQAGEADVGFTFNPPILDGLSIVHERMFRIGALMSPDHPLAQRRSVSIAECAVYPLAIPAPGLSLRALLDPALVRHGGAARPRVEVNSLRLMAALARRNGCIAFQTAVGIEQELESKALVLVPLRDRDVAPNRFVTVTESARSPNLAVAAFIEFVRNHLARPESRTRLRSAVDPGSDPGQALSAGVRSPSQKRSSASPPLDTA
jgi:DNA-binding transcriptional LysR family regulator